MVEHRGTHQRRGVNRHNVPLPPRRQSCSLCYRSRLQIVASPQKVRQTQGILAGYPLFRGLRTGILGLNLASKNRAGGVGFLHGGFCVEIQVRTAEGLEERVSRKDAKTRSGGSPEDEVVDGSPPLKSALRLGVLAREHGSNRAPEQRTRDGSSVGVAEVSP